MRRPNRAGVIGVRAARITASVPASVADRVESLALAQGKSVASVAGALLSCGLAAETIRVAGAADGAKDGVVSPAVNRDVGSEHL